MASNRFLVILRNSLGVESLTPTGIAKGFKEKFKSDSLFRNSVYLILSTTVQAVLGFVFWILAARLYSSEDIGIATALISAIMLLTNFSLLGFNSSFIRYLPKSKDPQTIINTGITAATFGAMVVALIYVLGIGHFSKELGFLADNKSFALFFIIFTAVEAVNTLTDSIFIAQRASFYNFVVYSAFSVAKIVALVALVGMGSYGVFFAFVGAIVISLILSIYFMYQKYGYTVKPQFSLSAAKRMARFSSANYVSTFATALPVQVFPIMIVNYLGASQAAYFYIASMIANMIYVIPTATSQSMFAEGSHAEEQLAQYTKGALKVTALICVPVILGVLIFGELILKVFGGSYSAEAYKLLLVFTLTTPLVSFFFIANTVLKIRHQMKALLCISVAFAMSAIAAAYVLKSHGTIGFAYALFLAYLLSSGLVAKDVLSLFRPTHSQPDRV